MLSTVSSAYTVPLQCQAAVDAQCQAAVSAQCQAAVDAQCQAAVDAQWQAAVGAAIVCQPTLRDRPVVLGTSHHIRAPPKCEDCARHQDFHRELPHTLICGTARRIGGR